MIQRDEMKDSLYKYITFLHKHTSKNELMKQKNNDNELFINTDK